MRAQEPRVGLDLDDQLAGGGDDEHAGRGRPALGGRGVTQTAREGGDQERGRLARARLGLAGHVLALQREGQRAFLDGRGDHEPRVADALEHLLGQIQRDEVERAHEVAAVSVGGAWALRFLTASRAQMMPTS